MSLSLENNILYLWQKQGGAIKTLYKVDMFKLEDDKPVSVPEDKLKAFKKKRQKAKSVKE
ncbi:hypothetical protein ACXO65_04075 [Lactobacillus delbrueckii subsp. bulgaricus]